MKAIQIPRPGEVALIDQPRPACPIDGVLIQTLYSGLSNGTERNILTGGNYGGGYPRSCGYQIVGTIVETGPESAGFAVGDTVFCGNTSCGHWEFIPAKASSLLVKLNADDDLAAMSLLAIATVAYRNVKRLALQPGERVLVIGGGVIGQVAGQVAQRAGAEVTLVAGEAAKLDAGRQTGFSVLDRHDAGYAAALQTKKPWHAVVETSGADILDTVIGVGWGGGLLAYGGRLALVAGRGRISYDSNAAQSRALLMFQSAHFFLEDLQAVAGLVRAGEIHLRPLITQEVSIDEAVALYRTLRDRPGDLFGAVFEW